MRRDTRDEARHGWLAVLAWAAFATTGCGGGGDSSSDVSSDGEVPGEVTGDVDGDTAADADADGDEDGEGPAEDAGDGDGEGPCTVDTDCGDGLDCTTDTCDTTTGTCLHEPIDAACNDGNPCTGEETCDLVQGCVGGTPIDCDDEIACTDDVCDAMTGSCRSTANHTLCVAPQICVPTAGGCADPSTCTTDDDCADGDACNGTETCGADHLCAAGAAVACDDAIDCTVDACNPTDGSCDFRANDPACADADLCNGAEICDPVAGCVGGTPVECDDAIDCTTDSCVPTTGRCRFLPDDTVCVDTYFCNGTETCDATAGCVAGPAPTCSDGIACTADRCDNATDACLNTPSDDLCTDDQLCNGTEVCVAATGCMPGTAPSCDDGLACTTDSCSYSAAAGHGACVNAAPDRDGDTFTDAGCTGDDCDDLVGTIHPGAAETCNGDDDDCDASTDETYTCVQGASASCPAACGSVGSQICSTTCAWGACTPPAESCNGLDDDCDGTPDDGFTCAVGVTEARSCGMCATQSRTCLGGCIWTDWTTCSGGGECAAGTIETRSCACGGSETRLCSTSCLWGPWSGCTAGVCTPGWTRPCTTSCDPAGSQTGTELCSASCTWSGTCAPPVESCNGRDDDCEGVCDDGWTCCAGSSTACTTACSTPGTGACSGACGTPATCCAASETCGNSCDDNCNGLIDDGCTARRILVLIELCLIDGVPPEPMDHVAPALANLGLSAITTTTSNATDFSTQLSSGPWDLVIVDEYYYPLNTAVMDQLNAHVTAGRPLILATWDLSAYAAHALITRAGITVGSSYSAPIPIYRWILSPMFTTPNSLPDLTSFVDTCITDGFRLTTTTATAQAGYTTAVTAGQAAITLSADHLIIVNGFMPQLAQQNLDGDGKLDMVELYENEIDYLF